MKFSKLSAALVLILGLSACQAQPAATTTAGTGAATTAIATTTPTATQASTTGAPETVYPYEFKGADGKVVTLDKEPQRIVSLSPTFTEVIFALGAGDRQVGRTDYCDFPAQAAAVTSVGSMTTPSVEKIVELKPDVILVSFMEQDMVKKIEQSGSTVIQLPSSDSIEGSYQGMLEIGRILNANDQAAQLTGQIKADIAKIAAKVKGLPPVSAYYVAGFGQSGDYTAGDNTFMDDLITAAGGLNVAKDAEGWSYTAEKLLEKDPQVIIIGSMAQMTDTFKAASPYKNLTAVKEDRVREIDDNLISREGPRMAEGVRILAEIFHPDAFK